MFQIAFPVAHRWAGRSLAVFACTSCVHEDYLIPQMLPGQLQGANIPDGFLESYQTNFRFLVFETGSSTSCSSYREKVRFKRLSLELNADSNVRENKIGGDPNWLLGDETPKTLGGKIPMCFLLQLLPGFQFEILASAPPQAEIGLDGSSQASPLNYYQLFNGNAIYLFGTDDSNTSLVYAITQI